MKYFLPVIVFHETLDIFCEFHNILEMIFFLYFRKFQILVQIFTQEVCNTQKIAFLKKMLTFKMATKREKRTFLSSILPKTS